MVLTSSQGALGHYAGPFLVPAEQSSPSLAQLSVLSQGCPAGPAALREQRIRGFPGHSEQPHALSSKAGGEKK